jgi:hypothetical protein
MALSRTQPIDRTNDAIKHKKRFKRKEKNRIIDKFIETSQRFLQSSME